MSKKKLNLNSNKQFGLLQRTHKIGSQEAGLITLSLKLSNEFRHVVRPKKLPKEKKPLEWVEARELGKEKRKSLSDAIKTFIEYAKTQGSNGADRYYINFTKMENSAFKTENRDSADVFTLNAFQMADVMIANILLTGIQKGLFYKDIFQQAKKSVENFAFSIGLK